MISTLALLSDLGLLVLIWLVQLIIYPSFLVISGDAFSSWHQRYSMRISFVVVPLMLAQVFLHALMLAGSVTVLNAVALFCIVGAWIATFVLAVPYHNALTSGGKSDAAIKGLIRTNWVRTVLWSITFVTTLLGMNA